MPNIRMLHICYFVSAVIIYHKYVFCEYINTERQPEEIVHACMIEEEGTYMRDYVQNERGKVERLEFDLIKLKKEET